MTIDSLTPVVTVKPLEWENYPSEGGRIISGSTKRFIMKRALHAFRAYFIEYDEDKDAYWATDGLLGKEIAGPFNNDYEARGACDAHFGSRIMESLALPDASQAPRSGYSQTTEVREITEEMVRAAAKAAVAELHVIAKEMALSFSYADTISVGNYRVMRVALKAAMEAAESELREVLK
jgi:hypothetical protein